MSKQTVIVTGASRGIGRSLAEQLADLGHSVIALSRNPQALDELSSSHTNITCYPVDLSLLFDVQQIADELNDGSVDAIVNNAGALINKPFSELTETDWINQFRSNVLSAVNTVQAFLPKLKAPAHILNISSMGGYQGSSKFPGLAAYSTSKGALSVLTESMAAELTDHRVNCLCLGAVQTEMLSQAFPGYEAPLQPAEMARFIASFLITAKETMNGQVIPVALGNP